MSKTSANRRLQQLGEELLKLIDETPNRLLPHFIDEIESLVNKYEVLVHKVLGGDVSGSKNVV